MHQAAPIPQSHPELSMKAARKLVDVCLSSDSSSFFGSQGPPQFMITRFGIKTMNRSILFHSTLPFPPPPPNGVSKDAVVFDQCCFCPVVVALLSWPCPCSSSSRELHRRFPNRKGQGFRGSGGFRGPGGRSPRRLWFGVTRRLARNEMEGWFTKGASHGERAPKNQ